MTRDHPCACGFPGATLLTPPGWGAASFGYVCCDACGMGRITPFPAPGAAERYDEGYFVDGGARAGYSDYDADERWHRRTARARLARVERWRQVAGAGLLVDVGTATGYMPDEARQRGYDVAAVEVSGWAADRARSRGVRVERALSDLTDLEGVVDVVTLFQVLEHMPDPADVLATAHRLLRPGGFIVCETWDMESRVAGLAGSRWQQLSPPSVLWLFTPESARRLVEGAGFEAVSWSPTPKVVSLATVAGQALSLAGERLERASRPVTSRIGVPYLGDDLVTFVARKS